MRDWIPSLLLNASRPADALSFIQSWTTDAAMKGEDLRQGGIEFTPPTQSRYPEAIAEKVADKADMHMLYAGALASFKLWGDCELANQFLGMAVKRNPWILIKIIDKVKQPCE